jgi:mannose-1-phosphate guanylyltransferase
MQCIVLAGGLGTRLRPLTLTRPKCLLPILDKTLIEHVILSIPESVGEIILTLGHNYMFPESLLAEKFPDRDIKIVVEEAPMGTGGAVKSLEDRIKGDFIVLNGDVLSSLDLGKMIRFHKKKKSLGTISLFAVDDPRAFGVVEIGKGGRINRFEEKPDEPFSDMINAGTYVLSHRILDHIPDSKPSSMEREVFMKMARKMHGYPFDGYWNDCGTLESFLEANRLLLAERGPLKDGSIEDVDFRGDVFISESRLREGAIGPNVVVGRGSTILEATISDSVLLDNVYIGSYATVSNSIIGEGCRIGKNCYIDGSILGDGMEIEREKRLVNQRVPKVI